MNFFNAYFFYFFDPVRRYLFMRPFCLYFRPLCIILLLPFSLVFSFFFFFLARFPFSSFFFLFILFSVKNGACTAIGPFSFHFWSTCWSFITRHPSLPLILVTNRWFVLCQVSQGLSSLKNVTLPRKRPSSSPRADSDGPPDKVGYRTCLHTYFPGVTVLNQPIQIRPFFSLWLRILMCTLCVLLDILANC